MRRTVASHGQVSNKPKQDATFTIGGFQASNLRLARCDLAACIRKSALRSFRVIGLRYVYRRSLLA